MKTWQIAELKNLILISEMPPMCELVWLPTFESEEASQKWNGSNGKEPYPVLARWHCAHCGGWHHWSGAETGNNGERLAGSFAIPERILKHIPREGILVPLDARNLLLQKSRPHVSRRPRGRHSSSLHILRRRIDAIQQNQSACKLHHHHYR